MAFRKMLPVVLLVSLLALVAPVSWLILVRHHRVESRILLFATLAIAVGFAITFIYNVPVNDLLETWNYNSPPSNARELWQPWESAHVIRTVFWGAGFVLEIVALALVAKKSSQA